MTELQPHRGILHDTARNAPGQQYWHSGQDAFGAYFPGLDVGPVWDWDGDGVANAEPPLALTPDETTGPPADDGDGPDNPIIEPPGPPPPEMRVMEVTDPPSGGDNPGDGDEGNPGDDDGEDGDEAGGDETGGDETGGDETGEDETGGDAFEGGITGELILDAGSDTVPIKDDETGGDDAFEGGITEFIEKANTKPEDPNGLNRDYIPNPPVNPPDGEDLANPEPAPDPDETTGPPAGDGEDGEATRPNKAYKIDDAPGLESPEFALNFDNDSDDLDRDDPTPHVAIPIKIKEKTALPNKKGKIEIRKEGDTYLIGLWLSDEDYGLYRPTGLPESFGQLLDLSQEDINNTWGA